MLKIAFLGNSWVRNWNNVTQKCMDSLSVDMWTVLVLGFGIVGATETAQWVNFLVYNHQDLCLYLQHPHKSWVRWGTPAIPGLGDSQRFVDQSVEPQNRVLDSVRDLTLKISWRVIEEDHCQSLVSVHTHAQVRAPTHPHKHVHTHKKIFYC